VWKDAKTAHACSLIIALEPSRKHLNAALCNKYGNIASCAPITTVMKFVHAVPEQIVIFGHFVSDALPKRGRGLSSALISHASYFCQG
jgi:hypothetical protein